VIQLNYTKGGGLQREEFGKSKMRGSGRAEGRPSKRCPILLQIDMGNPST